MIRRNKRKAGMCGRIGYVNRAYARDVIALHERTKTRHPPYWCSISKMSAAPLSDYAKGLQAHVAKRYSEKISAVGIDPFLIPEKEFDRESLPPVESIDLVSFLVLETSYYSQSQFKAFKSLQAYNQMISGFVKTVEGHVIAGNYVVIGKVRHSQKMNDPCVPLWIITNKEGTILSAHCSCMAGLGECCSHVASVLFYLETFNRIRGKLSCTQMKSYWLLPSFVKEISFAEVESINFSSAKKLKENLDQKVEFASTCSTKPVQLTTTADSARQVQKPDSSELNDFFARLSLSKKKPVVLSIIHPYSETFLPKSSQIQSIPDLFDKKYLDMEYHDLLKACSEIKLEMTQDELKLIEEDTREQASSSQFFYHRAGRIGASVSKQAAHTNPAQPSQSLIKTICYPSIFKFSTAATEHGCKHESLAIKTYENIMKQRHVNFKLEQCGLIVNAQYPWIHASPDFLCCCDCCGSGCGEVKCPYCLKDADFVSYITKKISCLLLEKDGFRLKKDHQYYYQVQQQLFTAARAYNDFVVCRPTSEMVELFVERVLPNNEHWNNVLPKINHFWRYCILPEILGRWYTQKKDINIEPVDPQGVCFCRTITPGSSVVSCSNPSCPISDFHLSCLKITDIPNNWLCPLCQKAPTSSKKQNKSGKAKQSCCFQEALKMENICICKQKALKTDKLLECHSDSCLNGKYFHLQCVNYKRMPSNAATTWKCPNCKSNPRQTIEKKTVLQNRSEVIGSGTSTDGLTPAEESSDSMPFVEQDQKISLFKEVNQSAFEVPDTSSCDSTITKTCSNSMPCVEQILKSLLQETDQSEVICTGTSTGVSERLAKLGNLTEEHYEIICDPVGWLDCEIIHQAHVLLREIDPTMEGLQRPTLGRCRNFSTVTGQFIQILHTGNRHWVCVSTVGSDDGIVDLYDSLYHNIIETEVEQQVINLVGIDKFSGIRVVAVQQQSNGSDCGVFSIAFATCLIFGILPQTVQFDVAEMRRHLLNCLKNDALELFPML